MESLPRRMFYQHLVQTINSARNAAQHGAWSREEGQCLKKNQRKQLKNY